MVPTEELDRRARDGEWRDRIEADLEKLIDDMRTNTNVTLANGIRLADYIVTTDERFERLEPVVHAMDTMQAGIVVMGKLGDIIKGFLRIIKWAAAPVAAGIAVWVAYKQGLFK